MTQPLSPAAQAIDEIIGDLYDKPVRCVVAAALRAVADQVVPEGGVFLSTASAARIRQGILAIAAELEGRAPSPNPQPNPPNNHAETRPLDPRTGRAGHDQAVCAHPAT